MQGCFEAGIAPPGSLVIPRKMTELPSRALESCTQCSQMPLTGDGQEEQ